MIQYAPPQKKNVNRWDPDHNWPILMIRVSDTGGNLPDLDPTLKSYPDMDPLFFYLMDPDLVKIPVLET